MAKRRRKFFEIYVSNIAKDKTEIRVYANFLQDVDFDTWEQVKDPKLQREFEIKLLNNFLETLWK